MNEEPIFIRVVAPHFISGMEFTAGICTTAAPILRWALGKSAREAGDYFRRKRWKVTPMSGVCFCLRPASFGYSAHPTDRMLWACSPAHLEQARKTKRESMAEQEAKARAASVAMIGEYLTHLGKTDLATFDEEECDDLVRTVVETYRDAMLAACEPF